MILSIVIGAFAGLAAVTLKETVHLIQHFLMNSKHAEVNSYLIYFYPMIGIVATVFITRYYWKEKQGHGITDILYTISQKSSIMQGAKMYSRMITSAITVGFGGSGFSAVHGPHWIIAIDAKMGGHCE